MDGERLASVRAAAVAVAAVLVGLLATGPCRALPGPVRPRPTAAEILYRVSADDGRWYHVLCQKVKVKVDSAEHKDAAVSHMLHELGLDATELLPVQPVVWHLVTHPGSTGTEYRFGVGLLGAGLACQLVQTVMLHAHLVTVYAARGSANAPGVRQCASDVQQAVAVYAARLAFFGQHAAVRFLVEASDKLNAAFAELDAQHAGAEAAAQPAPATVNKSSKPPRATMAHQDPQDGKDKATLVTAIREVHDKAQSLLVDGCAVTEAEDFAHRVQVHSFTEDVFNDPDEVEDHHLLAMIENMDHYEYVDFDAMETDFWTKRLRVVPFRATPVDEPMD